MSFRLFCLNPFKTLYSEARHLRFSFVPKCPKLDSLLRLGLIWMHPKSGKRVDGLPFGGSLMFSTIDLKLEKWMEGMGPLSVWPGKSPHGPPTSKKLSTHQPTGRLTPPTHRPMNPPNPYMYRHSDPVCTERGKPPSLRLSPSGDPTGMRIRF